MSQNGGQPVDVGEGEEMMENNRSPAEQAAGRSRREFIRDAAAFGGTLLGAPALLTATADARAPRALIATASGTPKVGGSLIIGNDGGTAAENLNPFSGSGGNARLARMIQLFEWLADRDHNFNLVPSLGTEFTPSKAGHQMDVTLRSDVVFHNGKTMTADDVVYSYQYMLKLSNGSNVGALLAPLIDDVKAVGPLNVRFTFKRPFFDLQDFAALPGGAIVPEGYDPSAVPPIGTGPFKYESFTPGQQSVFSRNENYWGVGADGVRLPYVDTLTMIDMPDDTARVNALVSGAVDAAASIPYALLPTVQGNSGLNALISRTGNWNPITMRVDRAPFNDVRVRQAFRLIVDRPQMVRDAYASQAQLGNDLYAATDPLYDSSLPQRMQDIEQAKSLLKTAGRAGLTVQLVTSEVAAGVNESCVVFAQQAKAAGVTVNISSLDTTTFFDKQYLERVFSVDNWPTLSFIVNTAYSCAPGASYSETHWNNPQFTSWYYQLLAARNPSLKQEIAFEMQKLLWNEGGELIAAIPNQVDGYSKKVTGFVPDKNGIGLSYYKYKDVWFV
jgi:peptide/nickel transport system substrate-binding protein